MDLIEFRKNEINVNRFLSIIHTSFNIINSYLNELGINYKGIEVYNLYRSIGKRKHEELKKSLYLTAKCNLQYTYEKETIDDEVIIYVPYIIDDFYMFLSGQYKVPIIQLYDKPTIYKKTDKGFILKFKSNIFSASIIKKRKKYFVKVFNEELPLGEFYVTFFETNYLDDIIKSNDIKDDVGKEIIDEIYRCKEKGEKDCRAELIRHIAKNNVNISDAEREKKLDLLIYSLDVASDLDYYTYQFMETDFFITEMILFAIRGPIDDADLKNKRLRLVEYIMSPFFKSLHDSIISVRKHPGEKIKIDPAIIIDNCTYSVPEFKTSVGDVVRYFNIINPIGEAGLLYNATVVGVGGFKKENVPVRLRDIHDSHFGFLCAADTPDRDGCGILYNLVPDIKVTEEGLFAEPSKDIFVSNAISLVPFLCNDDPTRLQMASSQMKQAVPIIESEKPIIKSGLEKNIKGNRFFRKANIEQKVIYKDDSIAICINEQEDKIISNVYTLGFNSLYQNCVDFIRFDYNVEDTIKENDIIYYSLNVSNDGELSFGRNFLTVVMPFFGYNYEDAIVISEEAADKMRSIHMVDLSFIIEPAYVLLSLKNDDYYPLKRVGETLKKGEVYARMKNINITEDIFCLFDDPYELYTPYDCTIAHMNMYVNSYNNKITEYSKFIESIISKQAIRFNKIVSTLEEYFTQESINSILLRNNLSELNIVNKEGKYYYKKQKINGILVEYIGIYDENIRVGDKLANRHGNKGVVSTILPKEYMPKLPDGRYAEIVINPLGIISRMNVGQLMEMHFSESLYQLKKEILKLGKDKGLQKLKEYLNAVYSREDNKYCIDIIINDFCSNIDKQGYEYAVDKLYLLAPPFKSPSYKDLCNAVKILENFKEKDYVTIKLQSGEEIITNNPVSYGYIYFMKLIHRAADKISSRSIGPYNKKTLQPLGGKKNKGGHRFGEMEVWGLLAHNSKIYLKELLTSCSDSVSGKLKLLSQFLIDPAIVSEYFEDNDYKPRSLKLLEGYFNAAGITMTEPYIKEEEMKNSSRKKMLSSMNTGNVSEGLSISLGDYLFKEKKNED